MRAFMPVSDSHASSTSAMTSVEREMMAAATSSQPCFAARMRGVLRFDAVVESTRAPVRISRRGHCDVQAPRPVHQHATHTPASRRTRTMRTLPRMTATCTAASPSGFMHMSMLYVPKF